MNQAIWISLIAALGLGCPAMAGDWPAYMHDSARSGVTTNALALPLAPLWTCQAPAAPKPAWPDPQTEWTELPKLKFDDALHVVATDGRIFFGSSVDNQVHALDAATGQEVWSFFTDGPVRFAPAVANGRIYAASDDGYVYCLQVADGRLVWKFSGAPKVTPILGGGRLASLWPVRTGVLVENGTVYFASGIFPWHGVHLYALTANEGKVLWSQDGAYSREEKEKAVRGGFSPQGYLLATEKLLIAPGGRVGPTVWKRADGARVLPTGLPTSEKGEATGVYGVLVANRVFVGTQNTLYGIGLEAEVKPQKLPSTTRLVAKADVSYLLQGDDPGKYGRQKSGGMHSIRAVAHSGESRGKALWTYNRPGLDSMIVAGSMVISGGANEVVVLDAVTGKELWVGAVKGRAAGLAVAGGRLLVSTDQGTIHCFGQGQPAPKPQAQKPDWPSIPGLADAAKAAREILAASDEQRGFAVVTGPGADALACEIARQSELNVFVYETDEARGTAARKRVAAAGLYGWRVTVNVGTTNALLPYPDYMANLIVCAGSPPSVPSKEWLRVLRPCGGLLLAGGWGTPPGAVPTEADRQAWAAAGTLERDVRLADGTWTKLARNPLEGSGWWTHQYADAGNSGSSGDRLVKGRLETLWYGEPGADKFPDRHRRGSAPLILNGRVFCQGLELPKRKNLVFSFDAYNGAHYWEREVPGALRLELPSVAGNLAVTMDGLFVAAKAACHRLDFKTGGTKAVYETPKTTDGKAPLWGYVAAADGRLFGSAAAGTNLFYSTSVFAYDIQTGRKLWTYSGQQIRDTTVVYGDGRIFFLDNRETGEIPSAVQPVETEELGEAGEGEESKNDRPVDRLGHAAPKKSPDFASMVRTLVALDAETGRVIFEKSVDATGTGRWAWGFGSVQMLFADGKLILGGAYTPYGKPKPDVPLHRVLVLSARDGSVVWNEALGNAARPLVMDGRLLAPPGVFDLQTGAHIMRRSPKNQREYPMSMGRYPGCGQVSASASMVFGRNGAGMYIDLFHGGKGSFTGTRPGCFINIIPAGGVVVQTEASSGCACYHAMQGTVVFKPVERPAKEAPSDGN